MHPDPSFSMFASFLTIFALPVIIIFLMSFAIYTISMVKMATANYIANLGNETNTTLLLWSGVGRGLHRLPNSHDSLPADAHVTGNGRNRLTDHERHANKFLIVV